MLKTLASSSLRPFPSLTDQIPVPIIHHFLMDLEKFHKYVGFCHLGLSCQSLDNPTLRSYLNLPDGITGVVVNHVQPISSCASKLMRDDVIVAIDGHRIANDGTILFRNGF